MKRFLFLCCLFVAYQARAQIQNFDIPIYAGRIAERGLTLPAADSARLVTAVAYYSKSGTPLPAISQPYVIRSAPPGTSVVVHFERTNILPDVGWIELYVSGQVRAAGRLIVGKSTAPPAATNPATPVVSTPASTTTNTVGLPIIRLVQLDNIGTGYVVTHNQNTTLLTADFFWNDSMQRDYCWTFENDSPNSGHLVGPPTERFFGRLILTFYKNALPVSTN